MALKRKPGCKLSRLLPLLLDENSLLSLPIFFPQQMIYEKISIRKA